MDNEQKGIFAMKVKMFQVECGESILMHCDTECLLVDCGSRSCMSTAQPLFDNVKKECAKYPIKQALITHFHEDHINGFMYITDANKTNHIKFSRVYIPYIFTAGQHWNLIDYKLIEHYLSQKMTGRSKNFSLLDLLNRMVGTKSRITILERGSHFSSCNSVNDVLWPKLQNLVNLGFGRDIKKYFPKKFRKRVFAISNKICKLYRKAADSEQYDAILVAIENIEKQISALINYDFEHNRDSDEFKAFYKRLKNRLRIDDNNTSIVFQTNIDRNYLFTGDIGKNYLKDIVTNAYQDGINIHNSFFAVKAPHHGTVTHYLPELFDAKSSSISKKIVFISNGKAKSTGIVYEEYPKNANKKKYKLICTNRDSLKCKNVNTHGNKNRIICSNGKCPLKNRKAFNRPFFVIK